MTESLAQFTATKWGVTNWGKRVALKREVGGAGEERGTAWGGFKERFQGDEFGTRGREIWEELLCMCELYHREIRE